MDLFASFDSSIVKWIIIPLLIFLARICDVTIGTLRIVFLSKGNKRIAPLLGFFEVLIWLIAIGQVMKNLNSPAAYIGWAAGFATGNYIGLWLEERLALGQVVIRFITPMAADDIVERIRHMGYRVTLVDAHGASGKVSLIFMVVHRKDVDQIIHFITQFNPKAFYSIEDVRRVSEFEGLAEPSRGILARLFTSKKSK
ncbi:MAG: DUF2179 domain-containing protein [Chitinophagales bacterium]|nr:DUF2179 domain-containing protein [Chitinophagales bacterium]